MDRKTFIKTAAAAAVITPSAFASQGATSEDKTLTAKNPDSQPLFRDGWTLAVLPDTQLYAMGYPHIFKQQTEWIAAHRNKYNIAFVMHEGDITNHNTHPEWERAREAMDVLRNAKIPFALLPGNHDLGPWGYCENRDSLMSGYFTPWEYRASEEVGYFHPRKIENSWHRITTDTGKFLFISMEFGPRETVLVWAGKVISDNPDHKVILATHAYLAGDGTRYDWEAKGDKQLWNPRSDWYPFSANHADVNDGQQMWEKCISLYPNVCMVLCGHVLPDGRARQVSIGKHGNRVNEILANYQDFKYRKARPDGAGFLRIMHFRADGKTVDVQTYSPYIDTWLGDSEHQFTIEL